METFLIDGKEYISTKQAATIWNVKPRTVANYCNKNKIKDTIKNGSGKWCIPLNAIKPLSEKDIHQLLVLTLQLKNNPNLPVDYSLFDFDLSNLRAVYDNLVYWEYIFPYDIEDEKRIPYDIILTQRGMQLATNFAKAKIPEFATSVTVWIGVLANISTILQMLR